MPHTKRCTRIIRSLAVLSAPLSAGGALGLFTPLLPDTRATLAVYFTGLAFALAALLVWSVVALQVAAHRAFMAGYDTSRHHRDQPPDPARGLRLVHDGDH